MMKFKEVPLRARRWLKNCLWFVALPAFCAFLLGASLLVAGELTIQLPPETESFKPAPGAAMANAQCLTCHSVDYVVTQPPFPRAFWAAEVKKMSEKYGASIPVDEIKPLVDYLAENYGTDTNHTPPVAASTEATAVLSNTPAFDVEALATKYGCLACHHVDAKVVGPALKDVSAKYRNDPAAIDKIVEQIHHGGSGKWGSAIMPPFPTVTDTEAKALAQWIMNLDASKP